MLARTRSSCQIRGCRLGRDLVGQRTVALGAAHRGAGLLLMVTAHRVERQGCGAMQTLVARGIQGAQQTRRSLTVGVVRRARAAAGALVHQERVVPAGKSSGELPVNRSGRWVLRTKQGDSHCGRPADLCAFGGPEPFLGHAPGLQWRSRTWTSLSRLLRLWLSPGWRSPWPWPRWQPGWTARTSDGWRTHQKDTTGRGSVGVCLRTLAWRNASEVPSAL